MIEFAKLHVAMALEADKTVYFNALKKNQYIAKRLYVYYYFSP
jgi:hypothetical protein